MRTILILLLLAADEQSSSTGNNDHRRCHALSLVVSVADQYLHQQRPLLREFGLGIRRRVRTASEEGGANRAGQCGAYTSGEVIPCLDMRTCGGHYGPESPSVDVYDDDDDYGDEEEEVGVVANLSSRGAIRRAFVESSDNRGCGGCSRDTGGGGDRESASASADAARRRRRHGRSSGSGCAIVRLTGSDASSVRGLANYAHQFFDAADDGGDDDARHHAGGGGCSHPSTSSSSGRRATRRKNALLPGVFRIDDHAFAGYDRDVNGEGRMQFLDTRILTLPPNNNDGDEERGSNDNDNNDVDHRHRPILLPLEVGELVGEESLADALRGMDVLLGIGTQITSAVLGMDHRAAGKLIDDGTRDASSRRTTTSTSSSRREKKDDGRRRCESSMKADDVSNSYHRLIRYVEPPPDRSGSGGGDDDDDGGGAAFGAHVDSTFLTLIPMPELPGLEVWCPSRDEGEEDDVACAGGEEGGAAKNATTRRGGGEWVRPTVPLDRRDDDYEGGGNGTTTHHASSCAYVIVLAGEFLQLTSNGRVPVCIHRVVVPPPELPAAAVTGTESGDGGCGGGEGGGGGGGEDVPKYKPRVSAPMFLRPRRGEGALLDVGRDLRLVAASDNSRNPPNSSSMRMTTTTGDMRRDDKQNCCIMEKG